MELNDYKIGEKFKPGDVLAFNPHFFKPMKNSKQVQFTLGVTANVWLVDDDLTNDDSSYLTEKLADRLSFSPVHLVEVTITKDTNIHQCSLVGTQVSSTDPIMVFDEVVAEIDEGVSEDLSEMLSNLNRSTPRAKHDGVVVSIDVYHTMPTSEMSVSVQRTINAIRKMDKEKSAFAEDTVNHREYKIPGKLETSNRIGIVDLDAETVVFRFYIRATNGMGGGDKLIVSSSLKSVVGGVFPSIGTTESGTEIDIAMAWSSVNKRLVTGCMYTGVAARVLKALGARVVAMNQK